MRGGCVDRNGRFWAGTQTGAFAYHPEDCSMEELPLSRQVDEVASDKRGNIWLKLFAGITQDCDTCLLEITPNDTIAYRSDQYPFVGNYICQMRFDRNDRLWLGTTHGLICRDRGRWIVYNKENSSLPTNYIYSLDFDSQNRVWCGTFGGGLLCFDGVQTTSYTTHQNLASNYVASVCVDKDDVVWFNCRHSLNPEIYGFGLSSMRNGQVTTYTASDTPLASNTIWDIQADGQNNLWLATGEDRGVTQFDGTHWKVYNAENSGIALNEATHITLDEPHNRIWFTCYSGGGVSYARLGIENTAVTAVNAGEGLRFCNSHLLFVAPTDVSLYDTLGRLVLTAHGSDIDLSTLPCGIYVVHAGQSATRIVIP